VDLTIGKVDRERERVRFTYTSEVRRIEGVEGGKKRKQTNHSDDIIYTEKEATGIVAPLTLRSFL